MTSFLLRQFGRFVREGNLRLTTADGSTHILGDGSGPAVHVRINTTRAERAIVFNPTLAVPEAYMNGDLDFVEGDVIGLLRLVYDNTGSSGRFEAALARAAEGLRYAVRRVHQFNTAARARRNVQHHYDLSGELYKLFL